MKMPPRRCNVRGLTGEGATPMGADATRTCRVCGRSYRPRAANQVVCGPECRYLHKKFGARAALMAGLDASRKRPCAWCGVDFTSTHRDAQCCSRACARNRWAKSNPMSVRTRRLHIAVGGSIRPRDWERLVRRYDGRCAYCRRPGMLTKDHIIPLSRGGRHTIGNVLPACRSCNSRKHTATITEWRARLRAGGDTRWPLDTSMQQQIRVPVLVDTSSGIGPAAPGSRSGPGRLTRTRR